ncbi:ABC transporter permease subunit, partial [Listeria monocytogenes]|nr:ABC transporter permease subunit [Listeria monocytogenes]
VIAADLISAETSEGTMKFLLTIPVKRWRILTSKDVSMLLSISAIMVLAAVIAYLIAGIGFGYGGWDAPVLTGFGMK